MTKRISILGSTGSIGTQTLDIIEEQSDRFEVLALTTNKNIDLLVKQASKFQPELLVVGDQTLEEDLKNSLYNSSLKNIEVASGKQGLIKAATLSEIDVAVVSVVGFSGVVPTISAIKSGKDIALANKETLVAAGNIVIDEVEKNNVKLLPIDSEHSAIFQSLIGEESRNIERLILTASGGPFLGKTRDQLTEIKPKDALKHPNWDMGKKISIDSATLMNKGLEVIEAHWLFGVDYDNIDVVIHPQSIVHSLVEYVDGAIKAELGLPDMKVPIQYALSYPSRFPNKLSSIDLTKHDLSFTQPDNDAFPLLKLAYEAGKTGGTLPCVLNAANEIAVSEFLNENITFLDIPDYIKLVMNKHQVIDNPSVENLIEADRWAREECLNSIKYWKKGE
ncbi:1-deoxy-D-xylulose-5-phosphate reductoisomerase [Natranaerobius trueperi]|uniref:1-deoxy-D-xylulose 5-phosphate reductoisomerase n=1 Tax=Natranaerobius trueperi TaxID=759412 RepID=A0A226C1H6_9FIRM|nr:1-deoxy-D-xylulose-5-phosphate reductoisomerase [Natranaerobius trueperi]OWZ84267.1 1-deoxy-D-xylulose-5-phosphate reductoisomerase [Natranaerobius trueperi]